MSVSVSPRVAGAEARSVVPLASLAIVVVAAGAAGFLATDPGAVARAVSLSGADLTRLLRAMAAIKMVLAAVVVAAVLWRLAVPVTLARLVAYGAACAAMAAGPGLIWDMVHVGSGAALLHGGLLVAIVLLWRDPAVAARLAILVRQRRGLDQRKTIRGRGGNVTSS